MELILLIDTSSEIAEVGLSRGGAILFSEISHDQKSHASFLILAIKRILDISGNKLEDLDAIAIANGPGSYTGIRVGLSTVKGLLFGIQKPLILVNKLDVMALASIEQYNIHNTTLLHCPMIDARRDEVFTALYNYALNRLIQPTSLLLGQSSFLGILNTGQIVFSGSGMPKWEAICKHPNALFVPIKDYLTYFSKISHDYYQNKLFENIENCTPFYLKPFYFASKN